MVKRIKIGKIQINFSNKWLYTFIVIGILAIIGIGVYAYGGSEPSVMGHSLGELEVPESLWSESGNDIYYNDGNVGIGINNPAVKLDIDGTIQATMFNLDCQYYRYQGNSISWGALRCPPSRPQLLFGGCICNYGATLEASGPQVGYSPNRWYCECSQTTTILHYAVCCSGIDNFGGEINCPGGTCS
jgi:hypothetical protein